MRHPKPRPGRHRILSTPVVLAAFFLAAFATACATSNEDAGPAPLRGTVALVGSEPHPQVVLRPEGEAEVRIMSDDAAPISRVSGAEVLAFGSFDQPTRRLRLERFVVVSVDGVPAVDGTLREEGDRLVLVTPDGRRFAIGSPPSALRSHVGARVWVSGRDLGGEPEAFGLIDP